MIEPKILRGPEDGAAGGDGGGGGAEPDIAFAGVAEAASKQLEVDLQAQPEAPEPGTPDEAGAGADGPVVAQPEQAAEPAPFAYEYARAGENMKLGKEDLDLLIDVAFQALEAQQRGQAERPAPERAPAQPQAPPDAKAKDPVLSRIEQVEKELKDAKSWRTAREQKEAVAEYRGRLDRELQSEKGKHALLKEFPTLEKPIEKMALAFMASNASISPTRALADAVKTIGDAIQGTKAAYAQSKIKAGQQAVERAGGTGAAATPKAFTGDDLMKGRIARAAVRELQASMND